MKHVGRMYVLSLIALAVLYFLTFPLYLADHDSGEFNTIAVTGGIAHPPGYPLLSVVQIATMKVFAGANPQTVLSALSIFMMLAAFALAFRFLIRLGHAVPAALFSLILIFTSAPVWRMATSSEPFALNFLMASGILFCLTFTNIWILAAAWHVMVLGMSQHHTLIFLLPMLVVVTLIDLRRTKAEPEQFVSLPKALAILLLGGASALWPLLYFYFANKSAPLVWGNWSDVFSQMVHHVLRRDYGTLNIGASGQSRSFLSLGMYLQSLPRYFGFGGLLLVIWGVVGYFADHRMVRKVWASLLAGTYVLSSIVFLSLFNFNDPNVVGDLTFRFAMLPQLFLLPFLAQGIELAFVRFPRIPTMVALCVLVVCQLLANNSLADRSRQSAQQNYALDMLAISEPNAVILTYDDPAYYGLEYQINALKTRSDIAVLHIPLWDDAWYRQQWTGRAKIPGVTPDLDLISLVQALLINRPVYLTGFVQSGPLDKFDSYPVGPLIKVSAPDKPLPTPEILLTWNSRLMEIFRNRPEDFSDRPWDQSIMQNYARPWVALSRILCPENSEKPPCDAIHKVTISYGVK